VVADARQEARISLVGLENLLRDLALIEGPKTMLVISPVSSTTIRPCLTR